MIVVANSGPLISLAEIGQFRVLRQLFGKIRIPDAVRKEVVVSGKNRPGASEVEDSSWIQAMPVRDITGVQLLRERLGAGESEAIVLVMGLNADLLLIDEARARRIAESRSLKVSGTVGCLVMAKRKGLIPKVTPLLDSLLVSGFRMSNELYRKGQALAGEV
ncbi:MAG: DUF3368 domain-containing protein [Deltaproteobacteria bacterium]|nr:MAG: DUF3368 domain-containing protein [Deltaproteobacteria bacterium]